MTAPPKKKAGPKRHVKTVGTGHDHRSTGKVGRNPPLTVDPPGRAAAYNRAFPDRPPLASTSEWVVGTWCVGNLYKNPNPMYGAYPRGYLERVHAMFPDARSILHAFSGGLTWAHAVQAAWPGVAYFVGMVQSAIGPARMLPSTRDMELVDVRGPDDGCHPTWRSSVLELPVQWAGRFDLVLADPPYSAKDAEVYGTPMPSRAACTRALRRVTRRGGVMVWLDTAWPMHRRIEWRTWAQVGLVRSTNHRVRLVTMFEAV